jgi:hypothetical protein
MYIYRTDNHLSLSLSASLSLTHCSEDELQDLDITKHKVLDRKRRDLSSHTDDDDDDDGDEESLDDDKKSSIEKRSNRDESSVTSLDDDVSELLEGSENSDDVQRRTRQLRPSIISSPWRISSARAVNFAPSHQNSFGSSFTSGSGGFPSSQSGFLFKSDGRFYPNNPFKSSQPSAAAAASSSDDFQPVISTYSGNIKNKYSSNSFPSFGGSSYSSAVGESSNNNQEPTPKYKQSSKIPSHSPAILPLLYSLESFEPKSKSTTQAPQSQDNYAYFHIGKSNSNKQQQQQQQQQQQDKVKTFAYPVTNQQPPQTTTQRSFLSFNSVGGFFNNNNNNQHQSANQGFLPLKPIQSGGKGTPAPIYEGTKSASSYDSRYTTPSSVKNGIASTPYASNQFLNNLSFKSASPSSIFSYGIEKERPKSVEKVVEITTKKVNYKQYPIPTSTPKYSNAFTTPNQLFDVDKFIAELRETQRLQNIQKNNLNSLAQQQFYKNQSKTPNVRYQYYNSPSTTPSTTSTTLSDEYYYDDEEEEEPTYDNGVNLSKLKVQNDHKIVHNVNLNGNSNKDSYSSHSLSKKPNLISSNAAAVDDDEYYEDYEDEEEEEEFQFLPPPVNKPKYIPMTETMAPRPINVTTLRPYYVSGHTFATPPPHTSTIPSIIKFPDDVFQAIRPFTSQSPKVVYNNNNNKKTNYDITKGTTSTSTTERTTTRKTKVKVLTKGTTTKQQVTSTTHKPTRTATTPKRRPFTSKAGHRGNSRFKVSTKRPDLTRLEIDEKLPNR